MADISMDMAEVRSLAADMTAVDGRLKRHLIPVVRKGGVNIKNQLRSEAEQSRHFKFAHLISFDEIDGGYGVEVGPEPVGAGKLENIAYFGGVHGGGGTVPDPKGALEAEAPKFLEELGKAAQGLIFGE